MDQQTELAFGSGEIFEPEICAHHFVRFNPSTGEMRCTDPECGQVVDNTELAEALPGEWFKPYDLILEL